MSYDDEYEDEEYEYEDEYEEELDEEDEPRTRGADAPASPRGLALGFLALLPLLVAYELGLAASDGATRSSAELLLFYATGVLGPHAELARRLVLGAVTVAAVAVAARNAHGLLPASFRQVVEGALAALVLGPALIGGLRLADLVLGPVSPSLPQGASLPPLGGPGIASAASVAGGAAYEELLFRLGAMSVLILAARSVTLFLVGGAAGRGARLGVEAFAVIGSALLFAAFHLSAFTGWLGPGGEPWDPAVFTWRALAGILLAVLFRWRGIGVAAWAHGLFNLALILGAGPDVFL